MSLDEDPATILGFEVESGIAVITADSLTEAAEKAVAAAKSHVSTSSGSEA